MSSTFFKKSVNALKHFCVVRKTDLQKQQSTLRFLALSLVLFLLSACSGDDVNPSCDAANLVITSANVVEATCGQDNGSVTFEASGGTGTLEFSLDGGAFQPNNQVTGVSIGTHKAVVKDVNGCSSEIEFVMPSNVILGDVQKIINTSCALPNCHNGSNGNLPNFTETATILSNAENIKSRTGAKTMPPAASGITLSAEEIAEIACWVDGGTPQ